MSEENKKELLELLGPKTFALLLLQLHEEAEARRGADEEVKYLQNKLESRLDAENDLRLQLAARDRELQDLRQKFQNSPPTPDLTRVLFWMNETDTVIYNDWPDEEEEKKEGIATKATITVYEKMLVLGGCRIEAIKTMRTRRSIGLREAKDAVCGWDEGEEGKKWAARLKAYMPGLTPTRVG